MIAMRPDKQLAGLLGLTRRTATRSNAYLRVNTATGPGVGIVERDDPVSRHRGPLHAQRRIQRRHALRERYHGHHQPGGHATQRRHQRGTSSRIHVRPGPLGRLHAQGNTTWVGQDRDGPGPTRSNDMYYGNAASPSRTGSI